MNERTAFYYISQMGVIKKSLVSQMHTYLTILEVLDTHKVPYIMAKTWTTDAFYRETREKVELRRLEGCVSVEMECAAFCAVAKFRDVSFGQILYGGDDLSCEEWDSHCWHERTDVRQKVFELAVKSCLNL
jgi:uridine phosphorylase